MVCIRFVSDVADSEVHVPFSKVHVTFCAPNDECIIKR